MKQLNLVMSNLPESDYKTGDPILEDSKSLKIYNIDNIPDEFFLYYIKLGDKHCNGAYGNAFKIGAGLLTSADETVVKRVKEGSSKILLSWPMESFLQDNVLDAMHNYFLHYQIPLNNVVYLSCCANAHEIYETYCNNKLPKERLLVEYIPWYLYASHYSHSSEYEPGKRKKLFFNLNRRMHDHRCLFLATLYKRNLLDNFFISFPDKHVGTNELFIEKVSRGYMPLMNLHGITETDITEIDKMLPLTLDINDWDPYPLPIVSRQLNEFYKKSLFSIVAETYFYSNIIHLTEKTFKPIVNHHPFIMIAAPGTLRAIKKFGFKTFDGIIDESYDDIENHTDRFNAILNIIEDISTWDKKKQVAVSEQIKEIVNYNYSLSHNRSRYELEKFTEKYGIEV